MDSNTCAYSNEENIQENNDINLFDKKDYIEWLYDFCALNSTFVNDEYTSDEIYTSDKDEKNMQLLPDFFNYIFAYYISNFIPINQHKNQITLIISYKNHSYEIKRVPSESQKYRYIVKCSKELEYAVNYIDIINAKQQRITIDTKKKLKRAYKVLKELHDENISVEALSSLISKIF